MMQKHETILKQYWNSLTITKTLTFDSGRGCFCIQTAGWCTVYRLSWFWTLRRGIQFWNTLIVLTAATEPVNCIKTICWVLVKRVHKPRPRANRWWIVFCCFPRPTASFVDERKTWRRNNWINSIKTAQITF